MISCWIKRWYSSYKVFEQTLFFLMVLAKQTVLCLSISRVVQFELNNYRHRIKGRCLKIVQPTDFINTYRYFGTLPFRR